ncbi:tRNA synthetases class II-domain-containing protein [Coniochaeta sp. 2T2.1]|nr:tRNA synthetases class II-domain-containing protein [Coniochaeta sp. 2T2.1]
MADAPQDTAPAADFPETARPFYAKIDRESKSADNGVRVTDAFDFFVRNQEVLSGGQRINNPDELEERIRAKGVDTYLATFRQVGVPPHGGVGFGLDRIHLSAREPLDYYCIWLKSSVPR